MTENNEQTRSQSRDPGEAGTTDFPSDLLPASFRAWLKVGDVMSNDPVTISPDAKVVSAAKLMSENAISCVVVVDHGKVVGMLTETDFLKRVAGKDTDFDTRKVAEIMSSLVQSVSAGLCIFEASRIMEEKHIKRLAVLEHHQLVGVITQTDLVRVLTSYGMWREVAEIMTGEVVGIPTQATVAEAAQRMTSRGISCIVALEGNEPVGVVTERDLLKRVLAPQRDPAQTRIEEVMSSPVISVPPHYSVFSASRIMDEMNLRRLVVREGKRLCGIVAQTDVFKAVRNKLQEEEEERSRLLDKSENGIYITDLDGKITYVNPAFTGLLEVSDPAEVLGQPFLPERFWHNPEKRTQLLGELKEKGTTIQELALKTSKGKNVYVTLFSTLTKDACDGVNGTQGVLYDITEKKELVTLRKTQEALRESEQRYRLLAENAKDVIWTSDLNLNWTYVSPSVELLRGYTAGESMAHSTRGILTPTSAELARKTLAEELAMAKKHGDAASRIRTLELEFTHKDGSTVWADVKVAFLCGKDGEPIGLVGVARDITERKRMEERLRESERKLRTILENTSDVITCVDKHGWIVDVNKRVEDVFGYHPDEITGKHFAMLRILKLKDIPRIVKLFADAVREAKPAEFVELELRDKNGNDVSVEVGTRFITKNGNVQQIVNIFRDISERKRTMAELTAAKQAAEAANRAQSEFLANVSHEIHTPMTAILGFADVLQERLQSPENLEVIETIKRNGQYLLRILNDILDLSKTEADELHWERIPCSPAQIVEEVASLMRVQADSKGLSLELEYAGPIPATISTDAIRLRQILINLVGNAIKFTETGTVRVVTRLVDSKGNDPKLQFDVIDTGIGMTKKQIARLFKPFTQGDASTSRKFGGTGLGLAISKRLASVLGGTIAVASKHRKGSTFTLTVATGPLDGVPMLDLPQEAALEGELDAPVDSQTRLRRNCRILLAEDGRDNQRLISLILQKAGAEVTIAENGRVALEKALSATPGCERPCDGPAKPFEVILMDMQMPMMDGYEATRRLRQEYYKGPIIALTAHATQEDRQKCLHAGCDDYLRKPIDREELLAMVAKHLPGEDPLSDAAAQVAAAPTQPG